MSSRAAAMSSDRSRSDRDSRRCNLESGSPTESADSSQKCALSDRDSGETEDSGRIQDARNAETDFVAQKWYSRRSRNFGSLYNSYQKERKRKRNGPPN